MALPAIPTRHQDSGAHRQRMAETVNGITSFQFDDSRVRTQAEVTAGVTPVNYAYVPEDARRYGAIADGDGAGSGTNNYTPLSNWLLANAGRNVSLPPGIYRCDHSLTVLADTYIDATGATLDFKHTSDGKGLIFTQRGGINNGKLLGPQSAVFVSGQMAISCQGTNNSPSAPTYVDGPEILGTEISSWGHYGCYFAYCDAPTVDRAHIHDIAYAGLGGVSCNDGALINSLLEDIGPGTSQDAYGAFWDRLQDTETVDPRSYRCIIKGNTFKNVVAVPGFNGQAMDSHAGVDMIYSGNTIENCQVGCAFVMSSINGTPSLAPIRCKEFGNVYNLAAQDGYGVILSGAYNAGVLQAYAVDCEIGPSLLHGGGITNDDITGAITMQGTKNCSIRVGSIKEPKVFGVCINQDNVGFNISGGCIQDPFDGTFTVPAGICVRQSNNQGYIGGITFTALNTGLATYVAVQSIRISGSLSSLGIEIGRCAFVGIDATHLSYSENSNGVNAEGLYRERGRASFTLTSGNASTTQSVSFGKRFPSIPRVYLTIAGSIAPGGKTVALRTSNLSATGFDVIAYPYDLSSWSATATLDIDWIATT